MPGCKLYTATIPAAICFHFCCCYCGSYCYSHSFSNYNDDSNCIVLSYLPLLGRCLEGSHLLSCGAICCPALHNDPRSPKSSTPEKPNLTQSTPKPKLCCAPCLGSQTDPKITRVRYFLLFGWKRTQKAKSQNGHYWGTLVQLWRSAAATRRRAPQAGRQQSTRRRLGGLCMRVGGGKSSKKMGCKGSKGKAKQSGVWSLRYEYGMRLAVRGFSICASDKSV